MSTNSFFEFTMWQKLDGKVIFLVSGFVGTVPLLQAKCGGTF